MWLLIASCILAPWWNGRAAAADTPQVGQAWTLYFQGRSLTARKGLEDLLASPAADAPGVRITALNTLLQICQHSLAADCLSPQASAFGAEAGKALTGDPEQRKDMARLAGYYIDAARHAAGSREEDARILAGWTWTIDNPVRNGDLYLRRQVLAGDIHLSLDQPIEATRRADKILSLVAAMQNPQDDAYTVAWALSETISTLLAAGDTDRALRVYRAAGPMIGARLPPLSVDAAVWRLTESRLLQAAGADAPARQALDQAIRTIDAIEIEPEVRTWLLGPALTELATLCAARVDLDCARAALARHPFADRFAAPGRAPATYDELTYLAARAVVAGFGQTPDPVAAAALSAPATFAADPATRERLEVYRAIGLAMAQPPGEGRWTTLREAGRRVQAVARRQRAATFGTWYRSDSFDQLIFQLALTQSGDDRSNPDVALTLHQLASRRGRSFDADALTLLGQARGEMQRRSIHQALRLRARRDSLEETALRRVAETAMTAGQAGRPLRYDWDLRRRLRDFSVRIEEAARSLGPLSDVNLVTLKQLQSVLAPDEAVLTLAPAMSTVAYMCVRRNSTSRRVTPLLFSEYVIDFRLLQQALTAGHAPSEALDAQYPVRSATRLYDILIRPFAPCLKPGDRIVWLPNLTLTPIPLAALLEQAPPRAGAGYDLSSAAWVARSHAVTYAGAASTVVALRRARFAPAAAFDFLGVGDPLLATPRAQAAFPGLAPLPETRPELERSARGFRTSSVLTGAAATEAGFRSQLTGAYRYISFATHGLVRDEVKGLAEPALVLTPASEDNALDDGLLTASEIADLNLAAQFVALSACNTANFDLARVAQDLPALASAFAVAGVPSSLGTMWPVNSQTGEQVVAATFENLRNGRSPAVALAEAQRAFLDAPPSRAYLHPRFWAPFVVMGDGTGGPETSPSRGLALNSVDVLTHGGGEVLRLEPQGDRVLAQLVTEKDSQGQFGSAVRSLGPRGEVWRQDRLGVGAGMLLARLGDRILAGGSAFEASGRIRPRLEFLDAATGASLGEWGAAAVSEPFAVLDQGERIDANRAIFGVTTLVRPGSADRPKVHVFTTDATGPPKPLFSFEAPQGVSIDETTLTPWNGALIATFTARYAAPPTSAGRVEDDFDSPLCGYRSMTWVEIRDPMSGALRASRAMPGQVVVAAAVDRRGRLLLAGAAEPSCGLEARGVVLALDKSLRDRRVYRDEALGASEVRALAPLADGRVVVVANKDNVVDFRPLSKDLAKPVDIHRLPLLYSAALVVLDPDGKAGEPLVINAGASVLATTVAQGGGGEILVGGSVGESATILHLQQDGARPGS